MGRHTMWRCNRPRTGAQSQLALPERTDPSFATAWSCFPAETSCRTRPAACLTLSTQALTFTAWSAPAPSNARTAMARPKATTTAGARILGSPFPALASARSSSFCWAVFRRGGFAGQYLFSKGNNRGQGSFECSTSFHGSALPASAAAAAALSPATHRASAGQAPSDFDK